MTRSSFLHVMITALGLSSARGHMASHPQGCQKLHLEAAVSAGLVVAVEQAGGAIASAGARGGAVQALRAAVQCALDHQPPGGVEPGGDTASPASTPTDPWPQGTWGWLSVE